MNHSQKIILLDSLETGKYKYTLSKGHVLAQREDLLMLMDGARSSYVFYSEKGVVGSTLAKVTINDLPPSMLYHFFVTNKGWLIINNTGAAIPHANKSFINKINFNFPPKEIIAAWKSHIDPINKSIWGLKDQNSLLKEARDILLPRLMTGMIDVDKIKLPKPLPAD